MKEDPSQTMSLIGLMKRHDPLAFEQLTGKAVPKVDIDPELLQVIGRNSNKSKQLKAAQADASDIASKQPHRGGSPTVHVEPKPQGISTANNVGAGRVDMRVSGTMRRKSAHDKLAVGNETADLMANGGVHATGMGKGSHRM